MRRILWDTGLFVGWVIAVIAYALVLYGVLEHLRPSPTGEHGPVAAGSIVVVASFLAFLMRRLWMRRDVPPIPDESAGDVP